MINLLVKLKHLTFRIQFVSILKGLKQDFRMNMILEKVKNATYLPRF